MKRIVTLIIMAATLWQTSVAQDDDMYFVPTKKNIAREDAAYGMPRDTYYSGSQRSADDYNRSSWAPSAATGSASDSIIYFSASRGVLTDSLTAADDYKYTRRMSRFDDYTPAEAYWDGYRDGQWMSPWYSSWYAVHDPWYWSSPYYYSFYSPWHSSWYYSSWYSPWHYGWGSYWDWYGYPRYYGYHGYRGGRRSYSGTGVTHHKSSSARGGTNLGGYRSSRYQGSGSNGSRSLGGSRSSAGSSSYSGGNSSLGGSRSSSPSYSSSSSSPSYSGSSHSSSSSAGGRSAGGGHSYGGRR